MFILYSLLTLLWETVGVFKQVVVAAATQPMEFSQSIVTARIITSAKAIKREVTQC